MKNTIKIQILIGMLCLGSTLLVGQDAKIKPAAPEKMDSSITNKNSIPSIRIGKQLWMQKNLDVALYNDGKPIATGLGDKEWAETQSGAYAIYENKEQHNLQYGKLYNGFAVATGKLCPKGWRIPADKDWKELEKYIGMAVEELNRTGGRSALAEKLKGAGLWNESQYPIINSTGFTALPGGIRESNGEYITLKQYANFWTSTKYDNPYKMFLWNRHLYYNSNEIGRSYIEANKGLSCRCISEK